MKGSLRRVRENVWRLVVDVPASANGKRRQRTFTFEGNKRQAEKRQAEILTELNQGTYVEPTRLTVATYYERWLRDSAALRLRPHTLHDYRQLIAAYILPTLGRIPLDQLGPLHVQELYTRLLTVGGAQGRPLTGTTVRHVHKVLSVALRQALRWRLLNRNPLEGVTVPRVDTQPSAVLQDAAALAKLLEAATGTWLHTPCVLAVGASLCRGEVLALRWSDVDFAEGTITVARAVADVGGKLLEGPPKTKARLRTVHLPAHVLTVLRAHKASQAAEYLRRGLNPQDRYLIARWDGSPYKPDCLTRNFGQLAHLAGCPEVTFHGLRHTCATHLLQQGVPAHMVAEVLGHANPSITLSIYAHVLRGMRQRTAVAMDSLFTPETIEQTAQVEGSVRRM